MHVSIYMYMYIYTYIYVYVYIYIHIYLHIYIYIILYLYIGLAMFGPVLDWSTHKPSEVLLKNCEWWREARAGPKAKAKALSLKLLRSFLRNIGQPISQEYLQYIRPNQFQVELSKHCKLQVL